jgi:hypothetical protein
VDEMDVVEDGAEPPQPMEIARTTANSAFPTAQTQALMDFSRVTVAGKESRCSSTLDV